MAAEKNCARRFLKEGEHPKGEERAAHDFAQRENTVFAGDPAGGNVCVLH